MPGVRTFEGVNGVAYGEYNSVEVGGTMSCLLLLMVVVMVTEFSKLSLSTSEQLTLESREFSQSSAAVR